MVLGVISAKINNIIVSPAVAMAMPVSPHNLMAITVAIEDARMFTKLLPINITLISWSVLFNRRLAFIAPLWPLFFRCFRRYRLSESIAVSELEKNADKIIKKNKKMSKVVIEVSLKVDFLFCAYR